MPYILICLLSVIVPLVVAIICNRHFRLLSLSKSYPILMYYKIDLQHKTVTVISAFAMHRETFQLKNSSFRLVYLSDLEAFINIAKQLPGESYFIAMQELYSVSLKKALPMLVNQCISIFIYLPIIISSNNSQYQQQTVQQLNEFIFSKEFKNIFGYGEQIK